MISDRKLNGDIKWIIFQLTRVFGYVAEIYSVIPFHKYWMIRFSLHRLDDWKHPDDCLKRLFIKNYNRKK